MRACRSPGGVSRCWTEITGHLPGCPDGSDNVYLVDGTHLPSGRLARLWTFAAAAQGGDPVALRRWAERHEADLAESLYYARTLDVEARVRQVFNDLHNMTRREGRSTAELRPYLLS